MLKFNELIEKISKREDIVFGDGSKYKPNIGVLSVAKGDERGIMSEAAIKNFTWFCINYYRSWRDREIAKFIEKDLKESGCFINFKVPGDEEVIDYVQEHVLNNI